jgi:ATP-dependent Clp protease, protease subunit
MGQTAAALPKTVYGMFTGQINQEHLQRIFQGFGAASNSGVVALHAYFQSTGGFVNEGIALYNFFRTLPFELHLYNGGSVASIAAVAFLGAKHRYASANATFMIHKTHMSPPPGTNAARLRAFADSIEIDDQRTRAIFDSSLKLEKGVLDQHIETELPFTAAAALTAGIIHKIKDFDPPKDAQIFNI